MPELTPGKECDLRVVTSSMMLRALVFRESFPDAQLYSVEDDGSEILFTIDDVFYGVDSECMFRVEDQRVIDELGLVWG